MCFRGLLSEKSDESLFFLDIGEPKKAEQKGKYFYISLCKLVNRDLMGPTVRINSCIFQSRTGLNEPLY